MMIRPSLSAALFLVPSCAAPDRVATIRGTSPGDAASSAVDEANRRTRAYTRLPIRPCGEGATTPADAIRLAAERAPNGAAPGCFELVVRAVEKADRATFLNSEADYRDQRSLNVRLPDPLAARLRDLFGGAEIGDVLVGRPMVVRGVAFRQRIDFLANGRPTGKYYYQTHVAVRAVGQLARPVPPPF